MWGITWKGMWSHKRRLLGTTMAVVLGVAFLTASLTIGSTMTAGFDNLFREANAGTDVVVRNATEISSGGLTSRGSIDADARRRHLLPRRRRRGRSTHRGIRTHRVGRR